MITCHINLYGGRKLQILDDFVNKLNYFKVVVAHPVREAMFHGTFSRYIIGIICSVLDPDIKAVALKISVYRGPRCGGTSFPRDNFVTTLLTGCFIDKCDSETRIKISRKEAVTHAVLPIFPIQRILSHPENTQCKPI